MKFVDFINESEDNDVYKKVIDESTALELIQKNCFNVNYEEPFIRGMRGSSAFYILEGRHGKRNSVTKKNHLMVIIDAIVKSKYPNKNVTRSNSILFATYANKMHTSQFGERYYIFPYNDADLLYTTKTNDFNYMDSDKIDLYSIKKGFTRAGISDESYSVLVSDLQKILDDNNEGDNRMDSALFNILTSYNIKDADRLLKTIMDFDTLGIDIGKSDTIDQSKRSEVWTGDKVIAIDEDAYKLLYPRLMDKSK